jgi:hypothetical protein
VGEFESAWEAAGSRVGNSLDNVSAVVVVGHDPIATASVALGIGRAQAVRRRVAIGDLIGDVPPLRELITDDDPHGITDSFQYGVSLNKIARQIDPAGNLHVLPSGIEPIVQEEMLRSDRWRRLGAGFREVGALLLLAAPAAVPGVEALIEMVDGVVLVGGAANPAPNAPVLAEVASAARRAAPRPAQRRQVVPAQEKSSKRWIIPVAAAAAVAAVAVFYGRDYLTRTQSAGPAPVQTLRRDSAAASDSLPPTVVDSSPPLAIANPADSASASPFAVQIAMLDTEDGAAMRVNAGGNDFPAGTFAPVTRGADLGTWYRVVTGAYTDRSRADQLLSFLRTRGLVPQGWGTVIRAPLALQVGSATDTTQAAPMIADLQSRKVPVYALLQRDGSVRIYTGAFEAPEEAGLFKDTLKNTKNIDATLVYRVGRAY